MQEKYPDGILKTARLVVVRFPLHIVASAASADTSTPAHRGGTMFQILARPLELGLSRLGQGPQ
jgi:hypothetical protein